MTSCLIIDRSAMERDRIQHLLAGLGVDCVQLDSPQAGLRYCLANHPDLVMMDASEIPEAKEFLRLARHLGRNNGRPVVIFYSGKADVEAMGESILQGASDYLVKPFDRDLLQFKLRQAGIIAIKAA